MQLRTTISRAVGDSILSQETKVEMLSVKMHQTKAISWNQVKSGEGVVAAKKATTEVTQLLENVSEQSSKSSLIYMRKKVHQVREELFQELSEEDGKDNDELRNFAAKIFYNRTQDFWRQHSSGLPNDELLWRPRMQRRSHSWRRFTSG